MRSGWTLVAAAVCALGCGGAEGGPALADKAAARAGREELMSGGAKARPVAPAWIGGSPSHMVMAPGMEATYVGVWVDVPRLLAPAAVRPRLALSLVLDVSSSMAGTKMERAIEAAEGVIEGLAEGDVIGVVAFSDQAVTIAPPTVVGMAARAGLIARVRKMRAAGGTNLFDGFRAGMASMAAVGADLPVRSVIVVSDGYADERAKRADFGRIVAASAAASGAQVSAVGVGDDYDARTLGVLAESGGGRLFDARDPDQMASILKSEVKLLERTAASTAYVEIEPGDGVELLGSELGPAEADGDRLRVRLGILSAGQHRELLVRVRARGGPEEQKEIAKAHLFYRVPGDPPAAWMEQTISLRATMGTDWHLAEMCKHPAISAMVARHTAARGRILAAQLLEHDRPAEATNTLEAATVLLRDTASGLPPSGGRERLRAQATDIEESIARIEQAPLRRDLEREAKAAYAAALRDDGLAAPEPEP